MKASKKTTNNVRIPGQGNRSRKIKTRTHLVVAGLPELESRTGCRLHHDTKLLIYYSWTEPGFHQLPSPNYRLENS